MSRSLGDLVATQAGVIHKPEIKHFRLTQNDKALVIASDGVWEFLSNNAVTSLLIDSIKSNEPKVGWEKVVAESVKYWKAKDAVIDDITIILAIFPPIKETPNETPKEIKTVSHPFSPFLQSACNELNE